ncbi:MAG: uroporphyrinogen-III synthase [Capnocytophaga sp.]|nr:uroporphyrinogen-III synthase [Capnocytophaga sp.]
MKQILSTRTLNTQQLSLFLNKGFSVTQIDFISIQLKEFKLNNTGNILLFTSQNAVRSVLKNEQLPYLIKTPCICVGEKTAILLQKNNFNVLHHEEYADDLGNYIKLHHINDTFTFFSGNLRKNTLPEVMNNNNITFNEVEVYKTTLLPHKIDTIHSAILFFSPSGVISYMKNNTITDEILFCIGKTTANELTKYTNKFIISEKPTIDSLIKTCIDYFH